MDRQAKARWVRLYSKAKLLCPERSGEGEGGRREGGVTGLEC